MHRADRGATQPGRRRAGRRRRTRRRILHRVVVRIRAGRAAARPIARNRNRSDARRACRPAPAGTAFVTRLSLRTVFERDSNPPPAGFRRLLHLAELPNNGRSGIRTRTRHPGARPFAFICPWRHALPRRTRFGGGAPAGLWNPGSRASGTSGIFYLARSVPVGVVGLGEFFNVLKIKENSTFCVFGCWRFPHGIGVEI